MITRSRSRRDRLGDNPIDNPIPNPSTGSTPINQARNPTAVTDSNRRDQHDGLSDDDDYVIGSANDPLSAPDPDPDPDPDPNDVQYDDGENHP